MAKLRTVMFPLRQPVDDVLAMARTAQKNLAVKKTGAAIHEVRIALKRWRALLRLLQNPVGKEAAALRRGARLLTQELSRSRDAQAALDALADISTASLLPQRTAKVIAKRLKAMREASENIALNAKAIQRLDSGLMQASACVATWPLDDNAFEDIAIALTQSYRRARRNQPRKWDKAKPKDIHDFRKDLITFRYQLDLIASLWPKVWKAFIGETQKARLHLGKSNDLVILDLLIQPKQPLAQWRSQLATPIDRQRQYHLNRAKLLVDQIFAEQPQAFRKRIEAMARRALTST